MHRMPAPLGRVAAIPSAALALLLLLGPGPGFAHAPSGAIFTTTATGEPVDANLYAAKTDVFLNGGPPWPGAAGLEDGAYVFQVTDPSGQQLLSEDASKCRVVWVEAGVIVARMDWTGDGSEFVPHTNGNDPCHRNPNRHELSQDLGYGPPAMVVQLMPYLDTPNQGGVYKVWVTRLEDYLRACDEFGASVYDALAARPSARTGCGSPRAIPGNFHGFLGRHSKTDNFKVREQRRGRRPPAQEILVLKFCDANCDGVQDLGVEPCLDDVEITVTATDGTPVCGGPTLGGYFGCSPPGPGSYRVAETPPAALAVCGASVEGLSQGAVEEVSVVVGEGDLAPLVVEFGNTPVDGLIEVVQTCASSGAPIGGVPVEMLGTDPPWEAAHTATTGADGTASFEGLEPGSYRVSAVPIPGLVAIGPTSCEIELEVDTSLDPISGLPQCTAGSYSCELQRAAVGDVGARTPGFWCNQTLREAEQHDPDEHDPGVNAACYQQLSSRFGSIQSIADAALAFWIELADGSAWFVDPSQPDAFGNAEVQQILCPQAGDAEQYQCHRQLFALLENVVAHIDASSADPEIGCQEIGVALDQVIVVDGAVWTVGALLDRVAAEGCTAENHRRIQAVNENSSTLLDTCPALVGP